jgi:hypothetical protein
MLIPPSTASSLGDNDAFVRLGEIMDPLACLIVIDNGPDRDFEDHTFAVATGAVGAFAVASALAFVFRVKAEVDERVMALAGFHHNVATAAAVPARGAAARNKLFPAKGHASVATVAGLNPNDRFINKHAVYIDCTGQYADSPQARSSTGATT